MAQAPQQTRRRRGSLRPDDIVSAAIGVIESQGVASLTMPAVASAVGAPTTSVYWYFRTRDELLVVVAERITAEFFASLPPVSHEDSWEDELLKYFTAFRAQLHAHPAFLELFTTRARTLLSDTTINQLVTDRLEGELGVLVRSGIAADDAYRIYNTISVYVRGYVMIELRGLRDVPPDGAEILQVGWRRSLDPAAYPVMSTIPDLNASTGGTDQQFQFGLRMLIEGTRALFATTGADSQR